LTPHADRRKTISIGNVRAILACIEKWLVNKFKLFGRF
jgi:hypothetical protein